MLGSMKLIPQKMSLCLKNRDVLRHHKMGNEVFLPPRMSATKITAMRSSLQKSITSRCPKGLKKVSVRQLAGLLVTREVCNSGRVDGQALSIGLKARNECLHIHTVRHSNY